MAKQNLPELRLHLTNVAGAGAVQLLKSLLPALERQADVNITEIHLPDRGDLSRYAADSERKCIIYHRWLPNAVSRIAECTFGGWKWRGDAPVLVLGDIPIRINARQTVFVQTTHLTVGPETERALKYRIARLLFRINSRRVHRFIVQTAAMKVALLSSYRGINESAIIVAPQPVPQWLIDSRLKRSSRTSNHNNLTLFYPAQKYPHKNHRMLGSIAHGDWPIKEVILTIAPEAGSHLLDNRISCVDFLTPEKMLGQYEKADALVFLSLTESFGFPLIEAMWIGLPIVCPDLPYARALCNDQAVYFDPYDPESLREALWKLKQQLDGGWWPNYSVQTSKLPTNWDQVADVFVNAAIN